MTMTFHLSNSWRTMEQLVTATRLSIWIFSVLVAATNWGSLMFSVLALWLVLQLPVLRMQMEVTVEQFKLQPSAVLTKRMI